ncbi:hypothetical protein [Curtobacterium sp. VKM Ac-1376]|uniref:hypothetical protein n=1 Tax=Curtobacterium sp. VKM Ac-1376 TaxID=123312 RepID=UPI00188CDD1F|nr:hypothetical protein [Curtobacterium sp. VKM Ac-1376]MBF4613772.1 hypothetical protein [Curtobacterium sp. VKM Ac-1376]
MPKSETFKTNGPGNHLVRCDRCRRRNRNPNADNGWNATVKRGVVVGYLCPSCQTPEENAEAEINKATTEYGVNAFGLLVGTVKADTR